MSNSVITTISLSKEQAQAVEDFNLKPSKLLQSKINEIIDYHKSKSINTEYLAQQIKRQEEQIKRLNALLDKAYDLFVKKGIDITTDFEEIVNNGAN